MKNTFMQSKETVVRDWYVIDATDMPLGRVASKAATILRKLHIHHMLTVAITLLLSMQTK